MDGNPIRGSIVIILLVLVNAMITVAETAFGLVNESNVRKDAEDGSKKAKLLVRVFDRPGSYINVIELLVTVIHIAIGVFYIIDLYPALQSLTGVSTNEEWREVSAGAWTVGLTVIGGFFVILSGTLFPRRIAYKNPEKTALRYVGLVHTLTTLLSPILWVFMKGTNLLLLLYRVKPTDLSENVTEDEIISMVNEGQEQGVIEADEAEMISNIIEFDAKVVRGVMTHRRKMVTISEDMSVEEALHFMLGENHSRYPLYGESADDIVGILYLKDVVGYYVNENTRGKALRDIAREPFFVPDTQKIDALFEEMQSKKIHMAIVIDEYGQTAGLVAMEDILEEIVGDIFDEYDEEETNVVKESVTSWKTSGSVSLKELGEQIGLDFEEEEEEYDTLNGLLISLIDHIPEEEEKAQVDYRGYRFEVLSTQSRVIENVNISVLLKEEE